jgi:hypothetical protein
MSVSLLQDYIPIGRQQGMYTKQQPNSGAPRQPYADLYGNRVLELGIGRTGISIRFYLCSRSSAPQVAKSRK